MTDGEFKVDFFCVGVAKAGTTSLHDLLELQEKICLPKRKETNYFSFGVSGKPAFTGPLDQSSVNDPTITSLDEYIDDFERTPGCLTGEVCPSYMLSGAARNVHRHNPDARIIILLREPVSRAFSNYQHLVRDGREQLTFDDALAAEDDRLSQGWEWFWGLKQNSLYADSVREYLDIFGKDQIKVIFFEDFIKDQENQLKDVMGFIGADPSSARFEVFDSNKSGVVSERWRAVHRVLLSEGPLNSLLRTLLPTSARKKLGALFKAFSTTKGEFSEDTRQALIAGFKTDLTELNDLVGGKVSDWLESSNVS